ncbi:MAG: hypothetical protein OEY36_00525 [Gammaproteobacteria bacterium]|nr:hypothetical protein [Gammaproteobacteria bacterium]
MISHVLRFFSIAAVVALAGCGSNSSGGGSSSISVTTSSGASVAITGSYDTACYQQNGLGFKENITFSGDSWTYTTSTYGGASCSGSSTDVAVVATVDVLPDQLVAGWVNGNGDTVAAPAGTAGASFTALNLTITSSDDPSVSVGMQVGMGYVVDDSNSAGLTLYRMDNMVNSIATIADPFSDIVISVQQSLLVTTATGGSASLQGTFTEPCYASDYDNDTVEDGNSSSWAFNGTSVVSEMVYYPSDTTCSGTPVVIETATGNLTTGSDATLTAWVDAFAAPASPPSSAGNAAELLPVNPPYTMMTIDIVSINGAALANSISQNFSFVVDDSHVSGLTIYQMDFDSTPGWSSVDDGRSNY